MYFPFVGENLNLCWSPDGSTVAVGNKDDLVSFIDIRTQKSKHDEQFKFEVNEISWNNEGDLFFLTSGPGALHIYRLVIATKKLVKGPFILSVSNVCHVASDIAPIDCLLIS